MCACEPGYTCTYHREQPLFAGDLAWGEDDHDEPSDFPPPPVETQEAWL